MAVRRLPPKNPVFGGTDQHARPRPGNPANGIRPTEANADTIALFDKFAEDVINGSGDDIRTAFDALNSYERKLVIEWLVSSLGEGDAYNVIHDAIWEIDFIHKPVMPEVFFTDQKYFGRNFSKIYDKWMHDLCTVLHPNSGITEWLLTGGIGTGKTSMMGGALGYNIYYMSCMRNPAQYYGLMIDSFITFGIYSITKKQVTDSAYAKLRSYLESSPYFQQEFPHNLRLSSEIEFDKSNVKIILGSREFHALGLDLYSFVMDEVNFMHMPGKTKAEIEGEVGQAKKLYDNTSTRVLSRFKRPGGTIPGIMLLGSSRAGLGAFLEERIKLTKNDSAVYVSDYAIWDLKPKEFAKQSWFKVEVGDRIARSRILKPDEKPRDGAKLVEIPQDYYKQFIEDTDQALRDIAGVATFNVSPLIHDRASIFDAITDQIPCPFDREELTIDIATDFHLQDAFNVERVCQVVDGKWTPRLNRGAPRYLHVDIALTGDCAGIAMSHLAGFKSVKRTDPANLGITTTENLPVAMVDFMLRIRPPPGSRIDLSKIRSFVAYLTKFFPVHVVTFDGYESEDSQQILNKMGIMAKEISVDRDDIKYVGLRAAFSERRIHTYRYEPFIEEVLDLTRDIKGKGKVDHPVKNAKGGKGSKDVADSCCGSVWNALHSQVAIAAHYSNDIKTNTHMVDPRTESALQSRQPPIITGEGGKMDWQSLEKNL